MNQHHYFATRIAALTTLLIVVATPVLAGCGDKPSWKEPGARQTFETFLTNIFRGEAELAFEAIAPDDRAVLTASLDELEGIPEDAIPEPHQMWVITAVDNPYDVKRVEAAEELTAEPEKGQRLELKISYHDGREGRATMVWGGERWFVDLPLDSADGADGAEEEGAEDASDAANVETEGT